MYCNRSIWFNIQVIKFKFCCNLMILQPLPNFKTQIYQKEEVGSYDNIALNQWLPDNEAVFGQSRNMLH